MKDKKVQHKPLTMEDLKGVDVHKLQQGAKFLFGANAPSFALPFDPNAVTGVPPAEPVAPKSPRKKK
jgi:hypothetical protein